MREEVKMKQSIIVIALILLFCGYYLTPHTTVKNKDNVETPPYVIDTQMQPIELLDSNSKFGKQDSTFINMAH